MLGRANWYVYHLKRPATIENPLFYYRHIFGKSNASQSDATLKNRVTYRCYILRNADASMATTDNLTEFAKHWKMADKYKQPSLCNYYCANQCPIGQQYVPEIKSTD